MNRRKFIRTSGLTFAGIAATGSLLPGCNGTVRQAKFPKPNADDFRHFWGDVHNHCNLTYGHGDLTDAFDAAQQQLDFVSVTPHAMWPDIPGRDDPRLEWVIEYHEKAFRRLRKEGWKQYVETTGRYNREGHFLTFLSYECHSMKHGDHVALNYDLNAPLQECTSVEDLKAQLKHSRTFVTPHHMGYQEGYRGYNWACFTEGRQTPFVEMFSRHGSAESDLGDYPYLHDMGPRTWEGSIQYGLSLGHKFGIIGSSDQHAGYPGSYGDGRIGVIASALSREKIWEALENRRVYCVTGDKIAVDFRINDAHMGEVIRANARKIYLNVEAGSAIDYVDIVKNGKTVGRISGPLIPAIPVTDVVRVKLKIEFGWNRLEEPVEWNGRISVDSGVINRTETCFRGAAYTSPQKDKLSAGDLHRTKVNKVLAQSDTSVELKLYSVKNPNTLTPATQAVILDLTIPQSGVITTEFNGKTFRHSVAELLAGNKAHFMNGWLSEAIQFHRAIPVDAFQVEHFLVDDQPENDTDYYYLRVRQRDNQWAWSSPIWVEHI
jgi:hypothetical protein